MQTGPEGVESRIQHVQHSVYTTSTEQEQARCQGVVLVRQSHGKCDKGQQWCLIKGQDAFPHLLRKRNIAQHKSEEGISSVSSLSQLALRKS